MSINDFKRYLWLCLHWKVEPTFKGLRDYKDNIK